MTHVSKRAMNLKTQKKRENTPILVVEDHPLTRVLVVESLEQGGFLHVDLAVTHAQALERIQVTPYSVVFLSSHLEQKASLDLLKRILEMGSEVAVILLSREGEVSIAVDAIRRGAFDILEKPLHKEKITAVVHRALEGGTVRTEIIRLESTPISGSTYHGLIGRSSAMKEIFETIERIRGSLVNVIITGPSGSGKERVAHALHQTSSRSANKFVAINCSAIPDSLLEGELFGYQKGAFTDARTDKIGLMKEADGGTLFLDEIGDMPVSIQPKILRALQEKEIRPLGSTETQKIDVRIISATNQDLKDKIEKKTFREDLYYRLDTMQINLPPLRERREDIPLLVEHFIPKFSAVQNNKIKGISTTSMKLLMHYSMPGNIRELENMIERAVLLAKGDVILPEDLMFSKDEARSIPFAAWADNRRTLDDIEREYILEVLHSVSGNRSETAHVLGIGRKTLYNKLAKFGLA